jgi:hypothetical protein
LLRRGALLAFSLHRATSRGAHKEVRPRCPERLPADEEPTLF